MKRVALHCFEYVLNLCFVWNQECSCTLFNVFFPPLNISLGNKKFSSALVFKCVKLLLVQKKCKFALFLVQPMLAELTGLIVVLFTIKCLRDVLGWHEVHSSHNSQRKHDYKLLINKECHCINKIIMFSHHVRTYSARIKRYSVTGLGVGGLLSPGHVCGSCNSSY